MNNNNFDLINQYKDKTYIYNILCIKTATFYNRVKQVVQLPIILISSIMAILNSTFQPDDMQVANVVLNGTTAFLMNLVGTYQIAEKTSRYSQVGQKWSQLLHLIEDKINNNQNTNDDVRDIIRVYDELISQSSDIPEFICNTVKRNFKGRHLPVILQDSGTPKSESRPVSNLDESAVIICDIGNLQNTQL
jgi:hypothetical protein